MEKKFRFHSPHYFSKHPTRGMRGLYWSVGLKDLGIAAVTLFEPIFLFSLGYSLREVLFFYIMIYGLYIVLLPPVGRLVGKLGYEHSILYSQFFLIAYLVALFSISKVAALFYVAPLLCAAYKSLYWPAYHADFALFSRKGQRGREVGYIETLSMIVYIIGPLIGGVLLEWAGFEVLFIVGSVLFILSALPLMQIREIHAKIELPYGTIFRRLVDPQHSRNFFLYLGFGEELIVLTVWPIFIYVVVQDYLEVGALVAVATFVTSLIVLYLGKISDEQGRLKALRLGTALYAFSWLVRGFAKNVWQVMSLDSVSRISKEMLLVPLEASMYSAAREHGPLVHAIFFELSLSIGKLIAAAGALIIAAFVDPPWVPIFFMSGAFSLVYLLFRKREDCNQ
ncbi:MAG: MFS transporter [Patescibacteria group bacterium]